MNKKLDIHEDFLSNNEHQRLQEFFEQNVSWIFGSQSDRWRLPLGHWNHEFLNTDPRNQENAEIILDGNSILDPIKSLWEKIREELLPGYELVRCYANAHTYGTDGYPHYDHRKSGNCTTLVYVNPFWTPDWAGETVFINEFDDVILAALPKPGRVVVFDSRIRHAARGVSRRCPALRVTLIFKSRLSTSQRTSIRPSFLEFLRRNGADEMEHSLDYSLFDHLVGTCELLREIDADENICTAGLFHSIYGTDKFTEVAINRNRREEIQKLIGASAEELVWHFCTLHRPELFEESLNQEDFRWADNLGARHHCPEELVKGLLWLECANLLEQRALAKYPSLGKYAQSIGMIDRNGV